MVDLAGNFQSYGRIYPFADAPDQYKEIVWWRVSEDTPPLPFPTPFCGRSWDEREQLQVPVVGTRYGPFPRYAGPLPQIQTGNICGTPEQWLEGLSYADYLAGKYHACDCPVHMPYVLTAAGGDVDAGVATFAASATVTAKGGDVDAGVATFATDAEVIAEGGDVDAGVATFAASATITAKGGDVDAGVATFAAYRLLDAQGGDVDAGVATFAASATITAQGGDVDAGIATGSNTGNTVVTLPGSGTNDASLGDVAWSNPSRITLADGLFATSAIPVTLTTSQILTGTNFGFSIPATAHLKGVVVTWNRKTSTANSAIDKSVQLTLGGVLIGSDKATATQWPTAAADATYGGTSDTWGTTLTGSDVNNSTFGAILQGQKSGAVLTRTLSVDYVKVQVYWVKPL